jgi:hypothetical protein
MKENFYLSFLYLLTILSFQSCTNSQEPVWHYVPGTLMTQWSGNIRPDSVWQEYPRPQMVRNDWLNLNGLWFCTITEKDSVPADFKELILVPFCVESALSGVGNKVGSENKLWYKKEIRIPRNWGKRNVLLHFEAVDWETTVFIDGKEAGKHKGGYDPFTLDITPFIKTGKSHELVVSVWDPTDDGFQPRGKQVKDPGGIFYTSSTGIWQTVWLELVPESYFEDIRIVPDIDRSIIIIQPRVKNLNPGDRIEIVVKDSSQKVLNKKSGTGETFEISIPEPELWTPDNPSLYGLTMRLLRDERLVDEIESYCGMRKISLTEDEKGFKRISLNNQVLFQSGPLDQGFWSDGIYTPPSDEAMRYDIEVTKKMGFNMLRKHVKVENRRFYYWCDRLGILVWQDMPSTKGYVPPGSDDLNPSLEQREQFESELEKMISTHYNHPSIVMWIPFNEGWGQYDTRRIVDLIRILDSTRLINNTSGWQDRGAGDVLDIHHYPDPQCPAVLDGRAAVLGEFGGLGFFVEGHTWQKENWGYEKMQSRDDLLLRFEDFYRTIRRMEEENGLSAAVYTQTTDVETETNGLMTYDRQEVKMGIGNIKNARLGIITPRLKSPFREFIADYLIELIAPEVSARIHFTLDGSEPTASSPTFESPVLIRNSVTLKAICRWQDGSQSREITYQITKSVPRKPIDAQVSPGLKVTSYDGDWQTLPDFSRQTPVGIGLVPKIDLSFSGKNELFGLAFEGYLDVPVTDVYLVYLISDDGARIYLDGTQFIDYDGIHGAGERNAAVALGKGLHLFRLIYFQRLGGRDLKILWESSAIPKSEISKPYWKHD